MEATNYQRWKQRCCSLCLCFTIIIIDHHIYNVRAVFTWLSKGIGFGFGFGFTTPFGWLVYLLWFWFYDSQVKTALQKKIELNSWTR